MDRTTVPMISNEQFEILRALILGLHLRGTPAEGYAFAASAHLIDESLIAELFAKELVSNSADGLIRITESGSEFIDGLMASGSSANFEWLDKLSASGADEENCLFSKANKNTGSP